MHSSNRIDGAHLLGAQVSLRSFVSETWAKVVNPAEAIQARIIPTWKAGRPLPAPSDVKALGEEGYRRNALIAACIWSITTSACEPVLVVKRRKADGTTELATGFDADLLRALLLNPNPEQSTFTFLEQLFTFQQISGNWFFRKLRADAGNVVALWPLHPARVEIIPGANGWVEAYVYDRDRRNPFPALDVVHDPLHPDPEDDFWGLSPIAVAARHIDIDNQASDYLRAFFLNNATPAGLLKLKARMEPPERERIKEMWQKEHSGAQGWHTVSVLDADGDYEEIGANPDKLRLQAIFEQTETRICSAFGVPAIVVGAAIGLNRSTFANFAEARRSFWQDTLIPLYKRCGQRLTEGLCKEFSPKGDLCIEFDLSTVQALQEQQDSKRKYAFDGWNNGLFTLNQVLELLGLPKDPGPDGELRKSTVSVSEKLLPTPDTSPLAGLLGNQQRRIAGREGHSRAITPAEKKAMARFKRVSADHFKAQADALIAHMKD